MNRANAVLDTVSALRGPAQVGITCALLAALAFPPVAAAQAPNGTQEALMEAESSFHRGDYKEAIRHYQRAEAHAGKPDLRCNLGLALAFNRMGAHRDAEAHARRALELGAVPIESSLAYNELGLSLVATAGEERERLEEAANAFRKGLDLSNGDANAVRFNLAEVLLKLGRDDEGVALLKDYLEIDPEAASEARARSLIADPRRARLDMMPMLDVVTLDGQYLSEDELRGTVVLVDFWGTWCPPCLAAIPELRRLHRKMADQPFVLLSISTDRDERVLRKYIAEHEMNWLHVWDSRRDLVEAFGVTSYPTYVLVDPDGVVVFKDTGWSPSTGVAVGRSVAKALKQVDR